MRYLYVVALFLCAGAVCAQTMPDLEIRVRFDEPILELTEIHTGKILAWYPVALPRKRPPLPVEGTVLFAEENPRWYPTAGTRAYYHARRGVELPRMIPPGDPRNAMGAAKIHIDWTSPRAPDTVRIHGTNDPTSIGERVSRGCIRMHNADILDLTQKIAGHTTHVVFLDPHTNTASLP